MSDIDVGQLSESINEKADRDLNNVDYSKGADVVVEYQEPTSGNNYTWYRKYKSGWVEQGGRTNKNISEATITLPITMANTDYHLMIGIFNYSTTGTGGFEKGHGGCAVSTTTIHIDMVASAQYASTWQVSGKSAS